MISGRTALLRAGAAALAAVLYAVIALARADARATRESWPKLETHVFIPPKGAARMLSLGYNELAADTAWARLLVYFGDGFAKGWSLSDVEPLMELVNALDPRFRRPYIWGGYATVFRQQGQPATQEEFKASIAILERGVAAYPDDWELNWVLGNRYWHDLRSDDPDERRKSRELGAAYIEKAMRCPKAPADLPLLAATMRTELGQHERALRELREMILTTEDAQAREKLVARYARMAGEDQGRALAQAREAFIREWEVNLPYAPSGFYIFVGPRPAEGIDLRRMSQGDRFEVEDEKPELLR